MWLRFLVDSRGLSNIVWWKRFGHLPYRQRDIISSNLKTFDLGLGCPVDILDSHKGGGCIFLRVCKIIKRFISLFYCCPALWRFRSLHICTIVAFSRGATLLLMRDVSFWSKLSEVDKTRSIVAFWRAIPSLGWTRLTFPGSLAHLSWNPQLPLHCQ